MRTPGSGNSGFRKAGGVDEFDTFVFEHTSHGANQRIGIFTGQRKYQLSQLPVRPNRAENLCVLHLTGHYGARDAFLMEQIESAAQFAQAHPMQPLCDRLQFRRSLLPERDYRHFDSLTPSGFEN